MCFLKTTEYRYVVLQGFSFNRLIFFGVAISGEVSPPPAPLGDGRGEVAGGDHWACIVEPGDTFIFIECAYRGGDAEVKQMMPTHEQRCTRNS